MKTIKIMDIQKKIDYYLEQNERHLETIKELKDLVKRNNRVVGKLRTALTHVGDILGESEGDENVFAITADGPTKEL